LRIECNVQPQPLRVGLAEVEIMLSDSHHAPVRGAQVTLEADMSHPGMKPLFQKALATEGGKYHSNLKFDMPGDWILLLHAKLPSGATVDNQVRLTVLEK
jgi:YtkA-like protein